MPRHASRGQQETAVRHLLRNLDDAAALRSNALLSPLFYRLERTHPSTLAAQTVALTRELIERAAESLGTASEGSVRARELRCRAILQRCDLRSESHAQVAKSLGLSLRQFYRERRAACLHVAAYIAQEVRLRLRQASVVTDPVAMEFARGRMLHECGESERSSKALVELLDRVADPAMKMTVWSALVDVLIESTRVAQAGDEVKRQRSYLSSLDRRTAAGFAWYVDAQDALLFWQSGNERAAFDIDERLAPHLASFAYAPERATREFTAKLHLQASDRAWLTGSFERARRYVDQAREIVSSLEPPPPVLQAASLNAFAQAAEMSHDATAAADHAFSQALTLAQTYGLSGQGALATVGLSVTAQLQGDLAASRERLDGMLESAEHLNPARRGELYLRAAELEASDGRTRSALVYARRSRECYPKGSLESTLPVLFEAQAYLEARAYRLAQRAAARAYASGSGENGRFRGTALRLLAESHWGLRERNAAVDAIRAAIAVLERFGHPFSLSLAYAASAKMTGNRDHQRNAQELTRLLAQGR